MKSFKYLVFSIVISLIVVGCGEDKPNAASSEGKPNAAREAKIKAARAERNEIMDKMSCEDAGSALEKNQSMVHVKTLLEKKCPIIYRLGLLKDDERAKAPMVEGCPKAFKALRSKGMFPSAGAFIKKSCKQ